MIDKHLAAARERQRVINAYKRTFGSEEGKVVLADIRKAFGVDQPAFLQNATGEFSPYYAAIRDGQRSVILHIERIMERETKGDADIETPMIEVKL